MKQFAKSLVSVVIALSILATMCIVGISASAKTHEFWIVTEDGAKDVSHMSVTKSGTTADFSVVDTSTLTGGTAGVPAAKAYKAKATAGVARDGFIAPINGITTNFADLYDVRTDATLDAWIWISNPAGLNTFIIRLYAEGDMREAVMGDVVQNPGNFCEFWAAQNGPTGLVAGWNHIQVKIAAGSWRGSTESKFNSTKTIAGYSIHNHSAGSADVEFALACMKFTYDDKNAENGVDKNEVGTTIISATAQKNAHDVGHAIHSGSRKTGEVSVVKTNTLTGGDAGVPSADAYMIKNASLKEGIVTAVDIPASVANTSGAYLNVWIYLKDASTVNNLVFRFYVAGKRVNGIDNSACASTQEQNGNKDVVLKNGWNNLVYNWPTTNNDLVQMTVHDHKNRAVAGKDNGTTDPAVYNDIAVACARIITDKADAEKPWDGTSSVVYPTDKEYLVYGINGEEGITGTYGAETYEGGTGAFATVVPAGKSYHAFMKNMSTPIDLTGKTVTAWVYVTDATKYDGQLEITSGGGADQQEYNWAAADLGIKNGWNKLVLDPNNKKGTAGVVKGAVGYAGVTGGGLDVTKANFLRIYDTGDLAGIKVGAVYVTPDEKDQVDPNKEFIDFTAETKDLADYHTTRVDAEEKLSLVEVSSLKKGSVKYDGYSKNAVKVDLSEVPVDANDPQVGRKGGVYTSLKTPIKLASDGKEGDYMVDMWVYFEGSTHDVLFQLYSDGYEKKAGNFNNTTEYWIYRYEFKSLTEGWNHISLKLSDFKKDGYVDTCTNPYNKEGWAAFRDTGTITGMSFHENTAANNTKYTYAVADVVVYHQKYASELVKTGDAVNVTMIVVAILMAAMAASVTVYFGKKAR